MSEARSIQLIRTFDLHSYREGHRAPPRELLLLSSERDAGLHSYTQRRMMRPKAYATDITVNLVACIVGGVSCCCCGCGGSDGDLILLPQDSGSNLTRKPFQASSKYFRLL